ASDVVFGKPLELPQQSLTGGLQVVVQVSFGVRSHHAGSLAHSRRGRDPPDQRLVFTVPRATPTSAQPPGNARRAGLSWADRLGNPRAPHQPGRTRRSRGPGGTRCIREANGTSGLVDASAQVT